MALDHTASPQALHGAHRLWNSAIGDDTSFLLARANALSIARTHEALAPFGLKVRSYALLGIAVAGTRPSQRELSEFLRLDPSQIVALVDALQDAGLVRREADPHDRRAKVVVATTDGARVFEEARHATRRSETEWLSELPEPVREHFTEALATLAQASPAPLAAQP